MLQKTIALFLAVGLLTASIPSAALAATPEETSTSVVEVMTTETTPPTEAPVESTPTETEPPAEQVSITFRTEDGTQTQVVDATVGTQLQLPADWTMEHHTLTGWSDGIETLSPGATVTVTGAATYVAQWRADTFTVSYWSGSTLISQEEVEWNTTPVVLPIALRDGTAIVAWQTASRTFVQPDTLTVTGDVSYYAWTSPILNTTDHNRFLEGDSNGLFYPSNAIRRCDVALVLYRLLKDQSMGTGSGEYPDVTGGQYYTTAVKTLSSLGYLQGTDGYFRPQDSITRAEFVTILCRVFPTEMGASVFSDLEGHWAEESILRAAQAGWVDGYPDGTFRPNSRITRAEAAVILCRALGRVPDGATIASASGLRVFPDLETTHWAYNWIMEAAVNHTYQHTASGETWVTYDKDGATLTAGLHTIDGKLYHVNWAGRFDSYSVGCHTIEGLTYRVSTAGYVIDQHPANIAMNVPYISQIDGIYAWVGCEAIACLMGLKYKGYTSVSSTQFLADMPKTSQNPALGFVGSPYVPDHSKRTTIYPAPLAAYANTYAHGNAVNISGYSVEQLRAELLCNNPCVLYLTLWWANPTYRDYLIDGTYQRLLRNNHAVLVCGYDPQRGYLIADPYNYYNRGQTYIYWKDAATVERIYLERSHGVAIR